MDSWDREILEEMKRELTETTANYTYRFNEPEPEIIREVPVSYAKNRGESG